MRQTSDESIISLRFLFQRLSDFERKILNHCSRIENSILLISQDRRFSSSIIDVSNLGNDITEIRKILVEVRFIQNHIERMVAMNTGGQVNIRDIL